MVEIIFKNVGQGDSIILKWESNNTSRIGIIDCNIYNSTNPILDYIKKNGIREIDFLLMSHPHYDHFSGFLELLKHCYANGILVNKFLHTSLIVKEYLLSASRSMEETNNLYELFSFLKKMRNEGKIQMNTIDDNPMLVKQLDNEFKLEFLSPSSIETDKYIKGISYPHDQEGPKSHPNANWLSTVVKISNDQSFVLLTSDVESQVLTRIGRKKGGRLKNKKVMLGQAPHHGAIKNLNKKFWNLRKRHTTTPIAISVGKNGYKHPSDLLIDYFTNAPNYTIYRTDRITKKNTAISSILNVYSKLNPKPSGKDIKFHLKDNQLTVI